MLKTYTFKMLEPLYEQHPELIEDLENIDFHTELHMGECEYFIGLLKIQQKYYSRVVTFELRPEYQQYVLK